MELDRLFWQSSVDEMVKGYKYNKEKEEYTCILCGENYLKGIIYKSGELFFEAERAMKDHIVKEHASMFEYLINMDKKYTGLTQHQIKLMQYYKDGLTDKEIVEVEGDGSTSTIRNHRFKFKEREKEAKVYLAIMQLMASKDNLISIHKGATMVDERYTITEEERDKALKNYFKEEKLKNLPAAEKKKIIILQHIMKSFQVKIKYTEKQVNEILKGIFDDYATIRRYLIEYGFMERTKDCSEYWVKM